MELIPVFAFIVLVASIATFIFSIAAYILYKVREKKGRFASKSNPTAFKAELISPNYYYLPNSKETDRGFGNNVSTSELHFQPSQANTSNTEDSNYIDKNNGNELVWR
jgi:hypothetical protein